MVFFLKKSPQISFLQSNHEEEEDNDNYLSKKDPSKYDDLLSIFSFTDHSIDSNEFEDTNFFCFFK